MDATVTVTGNVGSDVALRATKLGVPFVSFSLACTPRVLREGTWTDDGTMWYSVTCWRGLAENASRSLQRGDPVIVSGHLKLDSYLGKDGNVREEKVIEAATIGHNLCLGTAMFRRRRAEQPAATSRPAQVADLDGPGQQDTDQPVGEATDLAVAVGVAPEGE